MRSTDLKVLHPEVREAVVDLLDALDKSQVPLELYEAFRSPERQAELYARGRVPAIGGKIVTRAPAWRSYHQFGLAVDLVFWRNGSWSWDEVEKGQWAEYHKLAKAHGLEPLSFETPHVQLAGVKLEDLVAGRYPSGGDDSWEANLETAIVRWGALPRDVNGLRMPGAPPLVDPRPAVAELPPGMVYDEELGICRPA